MDVKRIGLEGLCSVAKEEWAPRVRELIYECRTPDLQQEYTILVDRLVVLHDFEILDVFTPFEWRAILQQA